jgi:osmotically-inducible protein OsmY
MLTRLDLARRLHFVALPLMLVACSSGKEASSDSAAATAAASGVADSAAGTTMQPAASADARDDVVERALDADAGLQAFALDADDDDGRIVLKGRVQSAAQRDLAGQIAAREAAGITVDNRIRVDAKAGGTGARPVDVDDIEDQVEDAFEADSTLRALNLDVDEEDGQLVLEGKATTAQRAAAEALAKRLAGTVTVVNRIRVQ